MCGLPAKPYRISLLDIDYVCVKAPMFSFTRLRGADPTLGVEMSSTGEVACYGSSAHEAFLQALLATNFKLPERNKSILVSIASDEFRYEFAEAAGMLKKLGYKLYGTPGTSKYYNDNFDLGFIPATKPESEGDVGDGSKLSALNEIRSDKIDLLINISEGSSVRSDEITAGYIMRRAAVDFGVSLITNVKCAVMLAEALDKQHDKFPARHIQEFYEFPTIGWQE